MFYSAASMMYNHIKISICLYMYTAYWTELIMTTVHYLSLIITVPECLKIAIVGTCTIEIDRWNVRFNVGLIAVHTT